MRDFEAEKRYRRLKNTLVTLPVVVLVAIGAIFSIRATWGMYQKTEQTEELLAQVRSDHDALAMRRETLKRELADLDTPYVVDREIRHKFGYAREGEEVVIIIDEEDESGNNSEVLSEEMNLWERFLSWFK
jgi:cell division protein FtsB